MPSLLSIDGRGTAQIPMLRLSLNQRQRNSFSASSGLKAVGAIPFFQDTGIWLKEQGVFVIVHWYSLDRIQFTPVGTGSFALFDVMSLFLK